jgi:hypothetical protein
MKLPSGPYPSMVLPGQGASKGDADGQADLTDELRARRCSWPPLRLDPVCREHESVLVVCPAALPNARRGKEARMRWFGLDVHRDFCEVAVVDEEGARSAGRIPTRMPTLDLFA